MHSVYSFIILCLDCKSQGSSILIYYLGHTLQTGSITWSTVVVVVVVFPDL